MPLPSGWFYTKTTEIDYLIQVISMQVKFYASLRQAAGTKMTEVEVTTGTKVRDVLVEVTSRYPALEKFIWKDQGELTEHAHVFLNGENIRRLDGLDTAIKPDDHVDIFPPLVGG